MEKKFDRVEKCAIFINCLIVLCEIIGFYLAISKWGIAAMGFYTQESNLILGISCLCYVIAKLRHKGEAMPHSVLLAKYISTCLIAVTFAVVVFIFVPTDFPKDAGYAFFHNLAEGSNLEHHSICPLLAFLTYFAFEHEYKPEKKDSVLALIPTLMYAIVAVILNVAKLVEGPYSFLYVYKQPIPMSIMWFLLIPGCGWLFAWFVGVLKRKRVEDNKKNIS